LIVKGLKKWLKFDRISEMKQINFNPSGEWRCPCSAILGEFPYGGNHIRIRGSNSQVYEIGFSDLSLTCDKCGREHALQIWNSSGKDKMTYYTQGVGELEVSEWKSILASNPNTGVWSTPYFFRKKLMRILTENEKLVYRLYDENLSDDLQSIEELHKAVALKAGLPVEIVKRHYDKIWNELSRIRKECEAQENKKISTDKT